MLFHHTVHPRLSDSLTITLASWRAAAWRGSRERGSSVGLVKRKRSRVDVVVVVHVGALLRPHDLGSWEVINGSF